MPRMTKLALAIASGATDDRLDDMLAEAGEAAIRSRKRSKAAQKNRHTESELQARIVVALRKMGLFVFHIDNGNMRNDRARIFAARRGVVSGMPDLCVVKDGGWASKPGALKAPARICFLEVKAPGAAGASERQRHVMETLRGLGAPCAVVRSVEEAVAFVEGWK